MDTESPALISALFLLSLLIKPPLSEMLESYNYFFHAIAADSVTDLAGSIFFQDFPGNFLPSGGIAFSDCPRPLFDFFMASRFLWTYSEAYRITERPEYLGFASELYDILNSTLTDSENGGFYWLVDRDGKPIDIKKVLYGQAFALYGLSTYQIVNPSVETEKLCSRIFAYLEQYGRDRVQGGYYEACTRDWSYGGVNNLGADDIACEKSMNTNLHMLEAYTRYYLQSRREDVREALQILGDEHFKEEYRETVLRLLDVSSAKATAPDGSLYNEKHDGRLDRTRIWWVQAEYAVGLLNGWEMTGKEEYLHKLEKRCNYIVNVHTDKKNGEWFWGINDDGSVMDREKGGMWKTPYHNGRASMELIHRIEKLEEINV